MICDAYRGSKKFKLRCVAGEEFLKSENISIQPPTHISKIFQLWGVTVWSGLTLHLVRGHLCRMVLILLVMVPILYILILILIERLTWSGMTLHLVEGTGGKTENSWSHYIVRLNIAFWNTGKHSLVQYTKQTTESHKTLAKIQHFIRKRRKLYFFAEFCKVGLKQSLWVTHYIDFSPPYLWPPSLDQVYTMNLSLHCAVPDGWPMGFSPLFLW